MNIKQIIKELCKIYGISYEIVMSKSKRRFITDRRYLIYYLIETNFNYDRIEIARMFNIHHSSITYAMKQTGVILVSDKELHLLTIDAQSFILEAKRFYKKPIKIDKKYYKRIKQINAKTKETFDKALSWR